MTSAARGMSAADRVRHDRPRLATVGEVDLCYETFGEPEQPTVLLIMGLGFQLIHSAGLLPAARRRGLPRRPLRQPRRGRP